MYSSYRKLTSKQERESHLRGLLSTSLLQERKENCELLPNPIYICGNSSEDVVICYEHSHLPKPFLSTPSQVKRVLINFKCPASSGKLFSVNKYKLNHQNMLHFQCLLWYWYSNLHVSIDGHWWWFEAFRLYAALVAIGTWISFKTSRVTRHNKIHQQSMWIAST